MSYYGFQILYHLLNREPDIIADRAYAPWIDFEEQLRKHAMPLYGLESKTPLGNFDVLGFTLPYELTYTNILNILDLANVPVLSKERRDIDPIVIAGGSSIYNPEPLTEFIDLFVVGDGEEIIVPLVRFIAKQKRKQLPRTEVLKLVQQKFRGLYIPMFYNAEPDPESGYFIHKPDNENISANVLAFRTPELKPDYFPEKPLIPVVEIAQDRLVAEIMRGCTQGCRFCQAGIIYRPVRERAPRDIVGQIEKSLQLTGYDNVSLLSLSSSDYCGMNELVFGISDFLDKNRVGLSLPSLRLDSFSDSMAMISQKTRKSGLTFAPEAGSARLRNVINKNISEEDLMNSVDIALKYGWRSLKLYFMLGLPTETDEDIAEIIRLTKAVYERSRKHLSINITLSTFIPKPFTPFQWEAQNDPVEIQQKLDMIKRGLASYKRIKIMARDPYYSQLEGSVSRGDRQMARAIYSAWKRGAKFDSWKELFNPRAWELAMKECGVTPEQFTGQINIEDTLPWDHIDARILKSFLLGEREKAYRTESTPDCRDGCIACGVCDFEKLSMKITEKRELMIQENQPDIDFEASAPAEKKFRLKYQKKGASKFISHLDTMRVLQQAFRRAKLKLSFTRGFNRRPKMSSGFPLPLGYSSQSEYLDIVLTFVDPNLAENVNRELPDGIFIESATEIPIKSGSLFAGTTGFDHEIRFHEKLPKNILHAIKELKNRPEIIIEKRRQDYIYQVDIRPFIDDITLYDEYGFILKTTVFGGQTVRPEEILKQLGIKHTPIICRLKTHLE
ncbi:MAG: TIGR03960 family B12-binding radical SAM protein [Candidatus Marinimicrobia bacterium]|nr:TIGR03960 family B12-binding radical SAM protein [Candidatus Neomarinimicrobiota bacterium]